MARYTITNEMQSIEFHDSFLNEAYVDGADLHMTFSDAIVIGHSCPELPNNIPCSVNHGDDRYACPQLLVTFKNYHICSVLRGGCWTQDAAGNTIEKYPPRNLAPEEYTEFLQMVLAGKNNQIYGLPYDAATKIYTLCFFMNADANYYEVEFTAEAAIAQFEEFGKEAWYLDSKWRKRKENQ